MPNKSIEILLIEDSSVDAKLTEKTLQRLKTPHRLKIVRDGAAALELLGAGDLQPSDYWPDLILLDLNLPKRSGYEVLATLKTHPLLKIIPVIVMTTSDRAEDIYQCYDLHANSYITKPDSFKESLEVFQAFEDFWMKSVRIPPRP